MRVRPPQVLAAVLSAGAALAVGWLLLRGRGTVTVDLVDIAPSVNALLEARAEAGPPPDSGEPREGALRREPIDEETAGVLFPVLVPDEGKKPRKVYDPLTYFENPPHCDFWRPFPEHPEEGWRIVTNERGFRDDVGVRPTPPDLRVLVTGDSHTEGLVGNAESFANLLEAELAGARPERSVEVLNAGSGGYAFYHYLGVLEKHVVLEPDVFVVVVYGGNDFHGVLPLHRYFNYLRPPEHVRGRTRALADARDVSVRGFAQAFQQLAFLRSYPEDVELSFAAARAVTLEIDRRCRAAGVALLVAYLPPLVDVHPDRARAEFDELARVLELDADDRRATDRLADRYLALLADEGIAAVDLRGPLRAASEPVYWETDHHLGLRGHEVVARALVEPVRRLADAAAGR